MGNIDYSPPVRTCKGCGKKREKRELIRFCAGEGRKLEIDLNGRRPGRGAYLCPDSDCIKSAVKKGALKHGLKGMVEGESARWIDEKISVLLEEELKKLSDLEADSALDSESLKKVAAFTSKNDKNSEKAAELWYKYRCLKMSGK